MRNLLNFLFGKPLASSEDREEKVGPSAGVAIFGLDALSSAAYGPEAAMTILIPLGVAGLTWILPITGLIVLLLGIVYFSYRQTIAAYPQGGGSYTVAHENLGVYWGLLAAAALMIDYILNVAVGISAGVGALVSAVPGLQAHTLGMCLGILVLLTLVNLRGVREAGVVFLLPTWLFIGVIGVTIVWGVVKTLMAGGHPQPAAPPVHLARATEAVGAWLIIKAFASGCTAMTGVEAVSNGVQAFREKVVDNARTTLTIIIAILMAMLLGIAFLVHVYGIGATDPGKSGYQSVLSQLIGAVAGRGLFYYISTGAILTVLSLSANTSFADFPRVCRAVAANRYLPWGFTIRGRRLVYSQGIFVLTFFSALLLVIFGGVTDRLIPLFAVGAFLAFTLSQAGMVIHWRKQKEGSSTTAQVVNAVGAVATGLTVCVVIVAKFTEGAWMTLIMIPVLLFTMVAVGRHYKKLWAGITNDQPIHLTAMEPPLMLVPIVEWTRVAEKALRFAMSVSPDVHVVHIESGESTCSLKEKWKDLIETPARSSNRKPPELVILDSPYRFVVSPIVDYARRQVQENPTRKIAVVIAEIREAHWYDLLLHNQRGKTLTALLMINGDRRLVVMNVPWYVD